METLKLMEAIEKGSQKIRKYDDLFISNMAGIFKQKESNLISWVRIIEQDCRFELLFRPTRLELARCMWKTGSFDLKKWWDRPFCVTGRGVMEFFIFTTAFLGEDPAVWTEERLNRLFASVQAASAHFRKIMENYKDPVISAPMTAPGSFTDSQAGSSRKRKPFFSYFPAP